MGNLWLKIKVWIKVILLAAAAVYILAFVMENHGEQAQVWFWYDQRWSSSLLVALLCTFVAGILFSILVRTVWKTYRQIAQLRQRNRTERLERDMAEMKVKASRLQTRPAGNDPPLI